MVNLKSTGIVRKVDELGRIVLPIELRRTLDIAEKDSLEIYMDGPSIVLKKYQPACIFCDDAKDVIVFHGKNICPKCIRALPISKKSQSELFQASDWDLSIFYPIPPKTAPSTNTTRVTPQKRYLAMG